MGTVLVICPTERDLRELKRLEDNSRYNLMFYGNNPRDNLYNFDSLAFIEKTLEKFRNKKVDGIIGTHDYPGSIIASVIARELNLPNVEPKKILLCQHKYYCRKFQTKAVPYAIPKFKLIDPYNDKKVPFDFPFFIKPVKSFFTILATQVNNSKDYKACKELAKQHFSEFVKPFNQLLQKYSNFELNANYLLAEELLEGVQITLEGFVYNNKVEIMGIFDSIMYPGTICFKRFEYPSRLSTEIQKRMESITKKFITSIGFNGGLFNIEMFYNPKTNEIRIIEVNPRMCSQFADLMEKVNGTNTYEIQLALSLGKKPDFKRSTGMFKTAASFVIRNFEDKKIVNLPTNREIENLIKKFPDARIEIFGREGMRLSDDLQDLQSFRYALINLGGKSNEDLLSKFEKCKKCLTFKFSTQ